jgi:hypothetical protein
MHTVLAVALALALSSCRTIGVEISDEALEQSIGLTEDDVREQHGVPHVHSVDSEGVELLGYGVEFWTLWSLDAETFVEFTLVDGRVTKTRRVVSRPTSNKNRAD